MKIIVANKFLYNRGGACIHALDMGALLKTKGHEVKFFGMDNELNFSFEEENYFLENVKINGNIQEKIKATNRIFGGGVSDKFELLIHDFKPDIIHLHNIHSYLSPKLAQIAYKHHIPVVWTLHDYKLICPSYSFQYKNSPCEDCLTDNLAVLKKKCMKNSLPASLIAWMEAKKWNKKHLEEWVNEFICPSKFLQQKMIQGGFNANKLTHICNFIDKEKLQLIQEIKTTKREKAYCYIGRLSPEKGVEILLKTANQLPYKLYIAGDGPLYPKLKKQYESDKISFLGRINKQQVIDLFNSCEYSIISSICYDNNPLGVIESLCCGTPVLGANIGGIPELINENNGLLFEANNEESLKSCIENAFNDKDFDNETIKNESIVKFSPDAYYNSLINLYKSYL